MLERVHLRITFQFDLAIHIPPLTILYQDQWIVAIDKPAGHLVHPAEQPSEGDLVAMKILRDQIGQQVNVIHRIDRPTCGVLLFAIEQDAARKMHRAFEDHQVEKIYWAVVDGQPEMDHWTCNEPLRKDPDAVERSAETTFRVINRDCLDNRISLIEARPKTGRFHQIRRHLLHCGYPIIGDYRYAGIERSDALGSQLGTGTRMLLQAKSLMFQHPITAEDTLIEAPADSAIKRAIGIE